MTDETPWGTPEAPVDDEAAVRTLHRDAETRRIRRHYFTGLWLGGGAAVVVLGVATDMPGDPGPTPLVVAAGLVVLGLPLGAAIHGIDVLRTRIRVHGDEAPSAGAPPAYREIPLPRTVTYAYLARGAERLLVWDRDEPNPPLHAVIDTSTGEAVWVRPDGADVLAWDDTWVQVSYGEETWSVRTADGTRVTDAPTPRADAGPPGERMMPPLAADIAWAMRRDRSLTATVDRQGRLRVVDGWTGEERLTTMTGPALRMDFTMDGRTLVVVLPTSIRHYPMPARA